MYAKNQKEMNIKIRSRTYSTTEPDVWLELFCQRSNLAPDVGAGGIYGRIARRFVAEDLRV